MEELSVNKIDEATLRYIEYNGIIAIILIISLVFTIIYSFKKNGISEVIENSFLWFLLLFGILNILQYPVDDDDEISAGIFFVAFGLCRIAKHLARKNIV